MNADYKEGVSNHDLIRIARRQHIPLDAVISKDRLKARFKPPSSNDFNLIINLQDLYDEEGDLQPGTHWVALAWFKADKKYAYFDSYGFPPPVDVVQFCEKHHRSLTGVITHRSLTGAEIIWTSTQIQKLNTVWCGLYALLFLDYMRTYPKIPLKQRYDKFSSEFNEENRGKNDAILLKLIRRYF